MLGSDRRSLSLTLSPTLPGVAREWMLMNLMCCSAYNNTEKLSMFSIALQSVLPIWYQFPAQYKLCELTVNFASSSQHWLRLCRACMCVCVCVWRMPSNDSRNVDRKHDVNDCWPLLVQNFLGCVGCPLTYILLDGPKTAPFFCCVNFVHSQRIFIIFKKPGLDTSNIANLRPVSNLTFMSKVIESRNQADEWISDWSWIHDLLPQSAYRKQHSTETAMLRVLSDSLTTADEQRVTVTVTLLGLLDLTAAFDCVDHSLVLQRLQCNVGLTGTALCWMSSFLTGRTQQVAYDGQLSPTRPVQFGVLRGSVLGPLLFVLYTAELSQVVTNHGLVLHQYADDCQVYVTTSANDASSAVDQFSRCLYELRPPALDVRESAASQLNQNTSPLAGTQVSGWESAHPWSASSGYCCQGCRQSRRAASELSSTVTSRHIMTRRQLRCVATALCDVYVPLQSATSVSNWLLFRRQSAVSMSFEGDQEVFASSYLSSDQISLQWLASRLGV